jgi:hypothetical protein
MAETKTANPLFKDVFVTKSGPHRAQWLDHILTGFNGDMPRFDKPEVCIPSSIFYFHVTPKDERSGLAK